MSNGTDLTTNRVTPVVDFVSLDFDGIKADLVTFATSKFPDRWTDFNSDQFAVVFTEMIAYLGDLLGYHINASIREVYAATVIRRQNLTNIMKPFGIAPGGPGVATADLDLTLDAGGSYPFTINPEDHLFSNGDSGDEVFFHPTTSVTVPSFPGNPFVLSCTEGEFFDSQLIAVSDGSSNQRAQFPQTGVFLDSVVLTVGAQQWASVINFINSSTFDEVYKLLQNDDLETFAIFPDGVFGIIPANNAEIRASFHNGGGTRGNLAKNTVQTIVNANANVLSVNNPVLTNGGLPPETLKEARNAIPNSLSTLERGVTGPDYAALALLVSGVAKAIGLPGSPAGSRIIKAVIAPGGGGTPTTALKNSVLIDLESKKMVTNRLRAADPFFRSIRLHVLLHVNRSFNGESVDQLVRNTIIDSEGTGLLDFARLDFQGIDDNKQLLIASTPIQDHFATLKPDGLDRAEVLRQDVIPTARPREEGNSGSGTISDASIITDTKQRRRQFLVNLISASQAEVFERIVGFVSELTDTVLIDDTKIFDEEGISDFSVFSLTPDLSDDAQIVTVVSAVGQDITVASSSSLFALTEPGAEYALFDPTPTVVNVGSLFTSADGSVMFTITAGTTPFINGDSFIIDIFPVIGDIRLRGDEYPQLIEANFVTRISGGT